MWTIFPSLIPIKTVNSYQYTSLIKIIWFIQCNYEPYFISIDDLYVLANLNNMLTLQSRKRKLPKKANELSLPLRLSATLPAMKDSIRGDNRLNKFLSFLGIIFLETAYFFLCAN